jgi:hypothetical protein
VQATLRNLIQVMLAKGWNNRLAPIPFAAPAALPVSAVTESAR